ncbi:MAG: response regulator transcription factor [Marinobacter sp.]|nr:response regulator transcription factor [Marinobacter sp.]
MNPIHTEVGNVFSVTAEASLPLDRVLIVDDHPFFSDGLGSILQRESLARVVAKASSVPAAMADLNRHPETALVLLDLLLQEEGGLTLFSELASAGLPLAVVVISSREDETTVRAARAAGALGFLPKSADRRALMRMMTAVSQGRPYYPSLAQVQRNGDGLTPRQHEVLDLLAQGLPNKRICQRLELTEHTVKTHLKAIFAYLGVHNRTECVAKARALSLIKPQLPDKRD